MFYWWFFLNACNALREKLSVVIKFDANRHSLDMSTFISWRDDLKFLFHKSFQPFYEILTRVQKCPDMAILNSLFGRCLLVFFSSSGHHSDQISKWSQFSKVILCFQNLKCPSVSQSPTDQG